MSIRAEPSTFTATVSALQEMKEQKIPEDAVIEVIDEGEVVEKSGANVLLRHQWASITYEVRIDTLEREIIEAREVGDNPLSNR